MKFNSYAPRLFLICAGVALGLVARMVLGVPETEEKPRDLSPEIREAVAPSSEPIPALPVEGRETVAGKKQPKLESGIVPPVTIPGQLPKQGDSAFFAPLDVPAGEFPHDPNAVFHAHGEQVCASGCAASRHPTATLTQEDFLSLIQEYALGELNSDNAALETLLYFGPQTVKQIQQLGVDGIPPGHAEFLWQELKCTSVKVSLRVVDQQGKVRTWLEPTSVPYDRRHVFDMKTNDLQSLVTSGTIKRVGLNHNWVRL